MDWLETLRMRFEHRARREPGRSPKRFAPYTVWSITRLIGVFAYAIIPLGALLTWLTQSLAPLLLIVLGVIIIVPIERRSFTALLPEMIAPLLGSRFCPGCGQSIFDRAPSSGYMPDHVRETWWPHRHCANCGHDLKVRTVD